MLSSGSKDSEMLQFKQMIFGTSKEDLLKLLAKFEISRSLKDLEILARFSELVPLTVSIPMIKKIISAFGRKLVNLLEERSILQNADLSKDTLQYLERFWSLCSRQQNFIASSQFFGKWHPLLLEEITPLASLFIDLFISAHGHNENTIKWSKKLYSWLNFDLPDRAIRIALLEAESNGKSGAEIVGPLLSQVLRRKISDSSDADYLLHILLLKKWHGLTAISDLIKESKLIRAPTTFLPWVKSFFKDECDFIPDDISMKGTSVSQFLLDLNTDDVLESLTDVLQMALFPENIEVAPVDTGDLSNLQFVVDKKGMKQSNETKKRKEKALSDDDTDLVVNAELNRTTGDIQEEARGVKDKPVSSPSKKKQKVKEDETEVTNDDSIGFFVDRGHATSEGVDEESGVKTDKIFLESEDSEDPKPRKRKRSLVKEENGDNGVEELVTKRRKESGVSNFDDDLDASSVEDEVENEVSTQKRTLRPRNLATAVLRKKNILLSDPVASSYFTGSSNLIDDEKSKKDANTSLLSSPLDKTVRSSPRINKLNKGSINKEGRNSPRQPKMSTPSSQAQQSPQVQGIYESPKTPKNKSTPQKKKSAGNSAQKLK